LRAGAAGANLRAMSPALVLAGGICALVIGMGVGRFAYTPLLPSLQDAAGMGAHAAGVLASINYVGYLIGALGAAALPPHWSRVALFRTALLVSIGSTALMALAPDPRIWAVSRLIAGIASAAVLILSSEIVVRVLQRHGRPALVGVHFAGVGLGIALTGIVTALLGDRLGWSGGWVVLAVLSLALAPLCWIWVVAPATDKAAAKTGAPVAPTSWVPLIALAIAYFCEGAGYVVTGTFLVAIVKAMPALSDVAPWFWVAVGLAGAPSAVIWSRIGARIGLLGGLVLAHLVQAIGIVMPVLSNAPAVVLVSALLFGATLIGITALVVAYAGRLANAGRMIGALTASFGLGQIVGPIVAGMLAEGGRGFALPLVLAAATVAIGGILLAAGAMLGRNGAAQGEALTTRKRAVP
jgi:predicted MFS family arabinose efflux permease